MTNDVVEHLAAIDVFEEKVEMALGDNDIPHCTNIRVPEERDNSGFTYSTNLTILIFRPRCISTS
jgi:hypothetical protein